MNRLAMFVVLMVMSGLVVVGERLASGAGMADYFASMPVGMGYKPLPQDPELYIKAIDPVANLTGEQKKSITEAFNLMTIEVAESNLKNSGHPDFTQLQAITKKSQERIEKVLTAAQVKLLKDADVTSLIKALAKPAELTEAQVKTIKGTVDCSDMQALRQAIADMLTPAQKVVYNKGRAIGYVKSYYWNAKLTEEQFKQVEAAADQVSKDASLSDVEVAEKIKEKIDPILTPEQKKVAQPVVPTAGSGPSMQPRQ